MGSAHQVYLAYSATRRGGHAAAATLSVPQPRKPGFREIKRTAQSHTAKRLLACS